MVAPRDRTMTIKRNGGIFFISAFGFSATVCKRKAPKPVVSHMLAIGAFVQSAAFFLLTVI